MKRVSAVVLTVVVLLVAAVALIGIPAQPLVGLINRQLEPDGYTVRFDGPARLSFWGGMEFTGEDIVLARLEEPAKDLLKARSIRIGISFGDIVRGRTHLTDVSVVRPVIQAEFGSRRGSRPSEAGRGSQRSLHDVAIDRVSVEDGTLTTRNRRTGDELKIADIQLVARHPGNSGLLELQADARLGAQRFRLEASTEASADLTDAKPVPIEARVELPGLLQRPASVRTNLSLSGTSLSLEQITGTAGGSRLFGSASLDLGGIIPLIEAEVELERVDLSAAGARDSLQSSRSDGIPWSERPIDLGALNFVNAHVKVLFRELLVDKVRIEPARLTMSLDDGVLTLVPTRLELYGGTAKGRLKVDASSRMPTYAAEIDVSNIAALSFLDDAFAFRNLDGRGRMKADLKAQGTSPRAIVASLTGSADIAFENGEIKGVSVPQLVQSVASHILNGWQSNSSSTTAFMSFRATFQIQDGKAATDNMVIVGPLLRSPGKGVVDLNTLALDFRVDPKVVADQASQSGNPVGIGVPIVIRGPWSNPQIYPELAGILENPEGAYAGLKNIFNRFTTRPNPAPGSQPNAQGDDTVNSLIQGIGNLFGPEKPAQPRANTSPPATPGDRREVPPDDRAQARPDDQERAREFLKSLFGN